jgi:hypothetical protein
MFMYLFQQKINRHINIQYIYCDAFMVTLTCLVSLLCLKFPYLYKQLKTRSFKEVTNQKQDSHQKIDS